MTARWKKYGNIFSASDLPGSLVSHASVPIAEQLDLNTVRIYFSARDGHARSHVLFIDMDIREPGKVINSSSHPVLSPGELGCFDDCGAMGSCLVSWKNKKYLYYIGWNLCQTVPFRNAIGLAVWDENLGVFTRCFKGPVVDRTKDEPHFTASCHVLCESSTFRMWYLSCVDWNLVDGKPFHRYHIKYAESDDGIHWQRDGIAAVDFRDNHEYAISVPRVINDNGLYRMWFSARASKDCDTYRIGYAESRNGVRFNRNAGNAGIDVSEKGWDSEMICYPFVFDLNGNRYMLYNGNGYGRTGFGLAILEQD
jgi:predicted GH43/DUF377 family glycosyl hydrolase